MIPSRVIVPMLLAFLGTAGCAPEAGDGEAVTYLRQTYRVTRVADEPRPVLDPATLIHLPDGGLAVPDGAGIQGTGPALRVSGAVERRTASDVVALYCRKRGLDIRPGWRGAPVRFDARTGDHVVYFDC